MGISLINSPWNKIIVKNFISPIILISGGLTLVFTIIQLFIDYSGQKSDLDRQVETFLQSSSGPLGLSLWTIDISQIQSIADGIGSITGVSGVEVNEGSQIQVTNKNFSREMKDFKEISIKYGQNNEFIGKVKIYYDKGYIFKNLRQKTFLIIGANFLKTIIVVFFLFILFDRRLLDPIKEIYSVTLKNELNPSDLQSTKNLIVGEIKKKLEELQTANKLLQESNVKQEILFEEVNHRVKNNFQMILSLLLIEQSKLSSEESKNSIVRIRERIRSLSEIHESFQSFLISNDPHFADIIAKVGHSIFGVRNEIKVFISKEVQSLESDKLFYLCLIYNELLSNSYKEQQRTTSAINPELYLLNSAQSIHFIYSDSGIFYRDQELQESSKGKGTGLGLVDSFCNKFTRQASIVQGKEISVEGVSLGDDRYFFYFKIALT